MKLHRTSGMFRLATASLIAIPAIAVMAGCNGDNDSGGPSPSPTPTQTPVPGNPFAGRYTGVFTGDRGQAINGSVEATVSSNGTVTGTARQREFPGLVFVVGGRINDSGQISVSVRGSIPIGPDGSNVPITSRLTGTMVTANGVTTGSGRFLTNRDTGAVVGTGTFKLAKKS